MLLCDLHSGTCLLAKYLDGVQLFCEVIERRTWLRTGAIEHSRNE